MVELLIIICLNKIPMLTQNDLKLIGNLIDKKLDKNLDEKFDEKLSPIKKSIKLLETKIVRKLNDVVDFFDDKVVDHERRIRILETKILTLN